MPLPTIEELRDIQKEFGLTDVHLIALSPFEFVIAHTDPERESEIDLHDCPVHKGTQRLIDNLAWPDRLDDEGSI